MREKIDRVANKIKEIGIAVETLLVLIVEDKEERGVVTDIKIKEIGDKIGKTERQVSTHLQILEDAGLIRREKENYHKIRYYINL